MEIFRSLLRCLLLCLSFGVGPAGVCRAQRAAGAGPFAFEKPSRSRVRIPVQVQRNLLVVSVMLNGYGPFNFLLDTGVATSIITSPTLADSLQLHHGQLFRITGAGGSDSGLQAYQADSVRVGLPGVVARQMPLLVLSQDVLNLSGYVGVPVYGILGSELFRSFVMTLRPAEGYLVATRPEAYQAPKGRLWSAIPLTIENNKAYFTAPVQLTDSLTLPLKLVLDTGASHALSIELDSDPRLLAPARRLPADLGRGLTGVVQGFLGRVPLLKLGRYTLPNVLTSFPNSADVHRRIDVPRNGNVGYELLKRFLLVIDYPHQRLLLRPNQEFRDGFEHDMCGVEFMAVGENLRQFVILRVMPNSPAAAAGLQPEMELVSINLIPANFFTLSQLSRIMHSQDGRNIVLLLRRPDGELQTATVRLKRQI
ncbi:MAG: aspartyl protease family protein [Bacteroidota bacterium]|nr:aspartyl protease family protein [Bacteroidota bacterium]